MNCNCNGIIQIFSGMLRFFGGHAFWSIEQRTSMMLCTLVRQACAVGEFFIHVIPIDRAHGQLCCLNSRKDLHPVGTEKGMHENGVSKLVSRGRCRQECCFVSHTSYNYLNFSTATLRTRAQPGTAPRWQVMSTLLIDASCTTNVSKHMQDKPFTSLQRLFTQLCSEQMATNWERLYSRFPHSPWAMETECIKTSHEEQRSSSRIACVWSYPLRSR